jgi:hypothetical protein
MSNNQILPYVLEIQQRTPERNSLMYSSDTGLDISPISPRRSLANSLSKLDEEEKRGGEPKCKHSNRNQRILHTTRRQPRGDPVVEAERHGISDENHGDKTLAAEIFVRVDDVVDGNTTASGKTEPDHGKTDNETAP